MPVLHPTRTYLFPDRISLEHTNKLCNLKLIHFVNLIARYSVALFAMSGNSIGKDSLFRFLLSRLRCLAFLFSQLKKKKNRDDRFCLSKNLHCACRREVRPCTYNNQKLYRFRYTYTCFYLCLLCVFSLFFLFFSFFLSSILRLWFSRYSLLFSRAFTFPWVNGLEISDRRLTENYSLLRKSSWMQYLSLGSLIIFVRSCTLDRNDRCTYEKEN